MEKLQEKVGLFGAVLLGLGSMIGTGVFVALGLGAGVAGPLLIPAVLLAGAVAFGNACSSAQLAAAHPASGGTFEYAHRFLHPLPGAWAGVAFLAAKSASAAAAALGVAAYLRGILPWLPEKPAALLLVGTMAALVLGGIRRSARANLVLLLITVSTLLLFCAVALPQVRWENLLEGSASSAAGDSGRRFLEAAALLFVAYTGYGRLATLAEEVRRPRRTIPLAIEKTLAATALLYTAVAFCALGAAGAGVLSSAHEGAPLEAAARAFGARWLVPVLALGAAVAMAGVVLNLLLGLSRVVLAMARRGHLPGGLAQLRPPARGGAAPNPDRAVLAVAAFAALLVLAGSFEWNWRFSAATVLFYYAITNATALRLPRRRRIYWAAAPWGGLAGCLVLLLSLGPQGLSAVIAVIIAGMLLQGLDRARTGPRHFPRPSMIVPAEFSNGTGNRKQIRRETDSGFRATDSERAQ